VKTRLQLRLRECLALHERRTGQRLTYRDLAKKAGLGYDTVKAIGSRPGYNASLRAIERLCDALGVEPFELIGVKRR
jgi:transcriptional regulator with XRE-family HTH domain